MPISKRKLTKWRKEALKGKDGLNNEGVQVWGNIHASEVTNRILLLTQELLDQQLLKEK